MLLKVLYLLFFIGLPDMVCSFQDNTTLLHHPYRPLEEQILAAEFGIPGKMVDVLPQLCDFACQNQQLPASKLLTATVMTQAASSATWPDPCYGCPKQLVIHTRDGKMLLFYEHNGTFAEPSEFSLPPIDYNAFDTFILYCHTVGYSAKTDKNHDFFRQHGIPDDPHTLVCMVYNYFGEPPKTPSILSERILTLHRRNIGLDFGSWTDAIHCLNLAKRKLPFKLILVNDTVRGPFVPWFHQNRANRSWTTYFTDMLTDQVKLAGTTINVCPGAQFGPWAPHVQSMLLATDEVGFAIGVAANVFTVHREKDAIIDKCEVGFSRAILAKGFNIDCLAPLLHGHDYRSPEKCRLRKGDVVYENAYFGASLHPYDVIFFKTNRCVSEKQLHTATCASQNPILF